MTDSMTPQQIPQRFNNLSEGDTLDAFEWFELMPCRYDESDGGVVQCEAASVKFWGLYGRTNAGTPEAPEYHAMAVHDAWTPLETVQIARQIVLETGKGLLAGCMDLGQFPLRDGRSVPTTDFAELVDALTIAIDEDLQARKSPDDVSTGDRDDHPLAGLRQAFHAFSERAGPRQFDPYAPLDAPAQGKTVQTARKIEPRCTNCGSNDVRCDAYAEWDPERQDWVLVDTYDTGWCNNDACHHFDCSTTMFDIDTGEELACAPGTFEYIPKPQADALWKQERQRLKLERAEREQQARHDERVAETAETLAAAYDVIGASKP